MVLRDPLYICGSVDEGRCENDGDLSSVIMFPIYAAGAILPDIVKWCDRWLSDFQIF